MSRSPRLLVLLLLAALPAIPLAACGDDDEASEGSSGSKTEQAFLEAMIPHHESAIEMAEVAERRGRHSEVKELAADIISSQSGEIGQMEGIHERLFGEEITPDPGAHHALGLSAEEAGMHEEGAAKLETAKLFDRAFIDEMIPHHRGAVRMAEVVLDDTDDAELRKLAEGIVDAQTREIDAMSDWLGRWYGVAPPKELEEEGEAESGETEEHH